MAFTNEGILAPTVAMGGRNCTNRHVKRLLAPIKHDPMTQKQKSCLMAYVAVGKPGARRAEGISVTVFRGKSRHLMAASNRDSFTFRPRAPGSVSSRCESAETPASRCAVGTRKEMKYEKLRVSIGTFTGAERPGLRLFPPSGGALLSDAFP